MISIYALIDPVSYDIRYVGKTKAQLRARLLGHVSDAKRWHKKRIKRFVWIKELGDLGMIPEIMLLESVASDDWQSSEIRWIAELGEAGCALLNATTGGEGVVGYRHSEEAKASIARKSIERYLDPAHGKKVGDAVRLAYCDPAVRKRLSDSLKTAFARPEVKARLCAAQRIACANPERSAAISRAHKGKIVSAETRRKLSEHRKGKKLHPEVVAKIAAGHRGLKRSEETKAKMRAAITQDHKDATSLRNKAAWATLSDDERTRRSNAVSKRMLALWAERKAAA